MQKALEANSSSEEIPNKLYFRIGEVSRLAAVQPYVLRFWETEFPMIAPRKSGTGHRLYRRKDVETVLEIKRLLYDQRFTIEGARKSLETQVKSRTAQKAGPRPSQGELFQGRDARLAEVRKELLAILEILR